MSDLRRLAFGAAFLAALLVSLAADAENLAELTQPGATVQFGGVEYGNFDVKIKGKGVSHDLSSYDLIADGHGFRIQVAPSGPKNKAGAQKFGGKIKLSYDAKGVDLGSAAVSVAAQPGTPLKVVHKLFDDKKLAKLVVKSDQGPLSGAYDLAGRSEVHIKDKIKVRGAGELASSIAAAPVPEPGTGLLLAAGLGGIAAVARRRQR